MTSRGFPGAVTQRDVLAAEGDRGDSALERALDACDASRAAAIVIARKSHGEPTPVELIARVLPGVRDHMITALLISIATGDTATAWLRLVQERRFPLDVEAELIETIVLYAAWRAGAPHAALIPEVRRLARASRDPLASPLLLKIAKSIESTNLEAVTKHLKPAESPEIREVLHDLEHALTAPFAEQLADLPETEVAQGTAGGFTVRVAEKVGRNEPCPCGSGLKYKKCCADKDAQVTPSPIAGMSWDDFLTKGAARMTAEDVQTLSLADLCRVDLRALPVDSLVMAFDVFLRDQEWARAEQVIALMPEQDAAKLRGDLLAEALVIGRLEVVERLLAQVTDPTTLRVRGLELELRRRGPRALELLEEATRAALSSEETTTEGISLALALARSMPSLGILAARGAMHGARTKDNGLLFDAVEDARDVLDLPPGDPVWDLYEELMSSARRAPDREAAQKEVTTLRSSLRATGARVEDLEKELAAMQAELKVSKSTTTAKADAPVDRGREKELRTKIEELQGLVREGNAERGELRKQLMVASAATRAEPEPETEDEVHDDDEVSADEIETRDRAITLPAFSRRFQDALASVPRPVGAETMRTIGELTSGDAFAWRNVKQAKDMPKPLYIARIGIHHRLLYRVEGGTFDVLDLVTREGFDVAVKRVRNKGA